MAHISELIKLIKYPNRDKIELITKAYKFAEKAHAKQKRYSGDPYFTHVFETAKILAELGMGRRTISAGLLHDVLEDAGISAQQLQKEFGKEILFLVEGVTKLGSIRYTEQQRHIESLRKFFVAMSQDIRVLIIKLADRLHNMRTLQYIPPEKQHRIAMETMEVYVPLAYRLGMRKLKRELEDLAFKYIEPQKYEEVARLLKQKRQISEKPLKKFRKAVLKAVAKDGVKNVTTDLRLKSVYSVYNKIVRRKKDFEQIYDVSAFRINVDTIADCYKVFGIIHALYRPLPGRIKDYIAIPKPNGYQSLHTTVFTGDGTVVEIQIRTHEMHDRAEYGIASHVAYKEGPKASNADLTWVKQFFTKNKETKFNVAIDEERLKHIPNWILQLVDVQSYVAMPSVFMQNLKTDFFQHRMFIFNPTGEVIDLPIGATPIDVAYEQGTEIGNHLFGCKINGKFSPIDTALKNADIVEIFTKTTSKPSEKWLSQCVTIQAKNKIREALEKAR